MTTAIYVVAVGNDSGKSLMSLGLLSTLARKYNKLGYFKPFTNSAVGEIDTHVKVMRDQFGISPDASDSAISLTDARALIARGQTDELSVRILDTYTRIAANADVVVIEGSEQGLLDDAAELERNLQVANDIGASVAAVVSGRGRSVSEVVAAVDVARDAIQNSNTPALLIAVNRANPDDIEEISRAVHLGPSKRPVYVFPEIEALQWPTVADIQAATGAKQIGGAKSLDRDVRKIVVAAMGVGGFLGVFGDGDFVCAPADRSDIYTSILAAALSDKFPTPSGVMVTGNSPMDERLAELLVAAPFPVLSLAGDTFTTTKAVMSATGNNSWHLPRRLAAVAAVWSDVVDDAELASRLDLDRATTMTPVRFGFTLFQRAAAQRKRIVLPEGDEPRILHAVELLAARNVVDLVLLGDPVKIRAAAVAEGVDISAAEIIDPATSEYLEPFAQMYEQMRKHKGVTYDDALLRMRDVSYFGTMMVQQGIVDGMVSGAQHTTAHTIRPSFEIIKTQPDVSIVSSVFLMCLADKVLVYGDCAVNPDPNAAQLADIAFASAQTASRFGIDPRVAMLSYSTGASGTGASVDKVREATALVKAAHPDLVVDGPLQYDAASNERIGSSKLPGSLVAGHATVFVFPDLDTGNNTYKAVQQSSGAVAIGPVLQGLRKPVNDLSRGCTVDDIVNTVVITAIQAQD